MVDRKRHFPGARLLYTLIVLGWLNALTPAFGQTNVIWRTAMGTTTYSNAMLMVIDEPSQKIYLQLSGPANRWFAWGFGNSVMQGTHALIILPGPTYQERTLGFHTAGTQLATQFRLLSSCTTNNRVHLFFERSLAGITSSHHTFSPGLTNLNMIWAVGASATFNGHITRSPTTVSAARVPPPRFTGIVERDDVAFIQVTNLPVGITNHLQVGTTLLSRDWSVVESFMRAPGCNPPTLSYSTNFTFTITNQDRAFFRMFRP